MDKRAVCFYGYTDTLPAMKKGRVESDLSCKRKKGVVYKYVSYDGETYSYTEYLRVILKDAIGLKENTYQDRTDYRVCYPNSMIIPLNKTQYEFCKYLWENGYADDAKAEAYRQQEKQREEEEIARIREQQKQRDEEIKMRVEEKKKYDSRIMDLCVEVQSSYPKAVRIVRRYIDKVYDAGKPIIPRLFHAAALVLNWQSIMADDICKKYAEADLRNYLATHNPCSRKLFTLFTGLNLPPNNKGTEEVINAWLQNPIVKEDI